jgi:putative transposase
MRSITRSYRVRAYPNGAQRRLLEGWFGASRWLWNTALGIRSEAYRVCGLKLTGVDLSRWLTQWKRTPGHEWLAAVPATCLTQCLRNQDAAFRNFFARRARYPKFKRKSAAGSLQFQDLGVAWARGVLSLPKLGSLKLAESLPKVERPGLVTLSRDAAGHYYVSFCAEVETSLLRITHRAVGVDLGRNLLAEGLRQLAGCDGRDLRVDAGDACPEEDILVQVLADEARSGRRNRACLEQAGFS